MRAALVLAAASCDTPDSSPLYRPAPADSVQTETPAIAASPSNEPIDPWRPIDTGTSAPSNESMTPPIAGPVSTDTNAGLPEAPSPTPPSLDAGLPSVPDASDAGSEPPPPPPVEPPPPLERPCDGALLDDICWYLGDLDQSCDNVCAPHGGFDPAATEWVGTPDQGGSIESCAALLTALDEPTASLMDGFRQDDLGFGCHLFVDADDNAGAWWLTAPAFSPDVSDPSARLVCGCAD